MLSQINPPKSHYNYYSYGDSALHYSACLLCNGSVALQAIVIGEVALKRCGILQTGGTVKCLLPLIVGNPAVEHTVCLKRSFVAEGQYISEGSLV